MCVQVRLMLCALDYQFANLAAHSNHLESLKELRSPGYSPYQLSQKVWGPKPGTSIPKKSPLAAKFERHSLY